MILAAKIKAMDRLRRLQATVLQQRDLIAKHHDYLLNEQRVAKAVFDKVAHSGCISAPNIRYLQSPYALFNGDLLLAAYTPAGDMHVLLGDFTGHGLPAAVGAMPLAEVFYGMTAKGYGLARNPARDECQAQAHPAGGHVLLRHPAVPELPAALGGSVERRHARRLSACIATRRAHAAGSRGICRWAC